MVAVKQHEESFIFEIKGLHKLWALRSQLAIPIKNVKDAYLNTEDFEWIKGIRMPGTNIPGLIKAGTYLEKDGKIFCDVSDPSKSIVIELEDETFKTLIIEVENPAETIELLKGK